MFTRRTMVAVTGGILLLGGALAGCTATRRALSDDGIQGRPVVLMLHERGLLERDSAQLEREWRRALAAGFTALDAAPRLRTEDVRVLWYADLLDARVPPACTRALGTSSADSARRGGGVLAEIAGAALGALADLLGSGEAGPFRGLAGDVAYVADARRRCAVEDRLTTALHAAARERRPVVLVAHSLGSVVAYGALERERDPQSPRPVDRLVTLGSPLGIQELRMILLGGRSAPLRLPAGVRAWTNVRDPDDALAAPVAALVRGTEQERAAVRDVATETAMPEGGVVAHELTRYLRDPAAARAVLTGWCAAFAPPREPPRECGMR